MNKIQNSLLMALSAPSPTVLWQLRSDLLEANLPHDMPIWNLLDEFHGFLNTLSASTTAHEYSKIATLLDIGAIGFVALEHVIDGNLSPSQLWRRLIAGSAGEGLMVLASRQYVKAFQAETIAVFRSSAWHLYQDLWQISTDTQPDLEVEVRRQVIDQLLAPIHDESVDQMVKVVLIGRLFQLLLVIRLNQCISSIATPDNL